MRRKSDTRRSQERASRFAGPIHTFNHRSDTAYVGTYKVQELCIVLRYPLEGAHNKLELVLGNLYARVLFALAFGVANSRPCVGGDGTLGTGAFPARRLVIAIEPFSIPLVHVVREALSDSVRYVLLYGRRSA